MKKNKKAMVWLVNDQFYIYGFARCVFWNDSSDTITHGNGVVVSAKGFVITEVRSIKCPYTHLQYEPPSMKTPAGGPVFQFYTAGDREVGWTRFADVIAATYPVKKLKDDEKDDDDASGDDAPATCVYAVVGIGYAEFAYNFAEMVGVDNKNSKAKKRKTK